MRLFILLIIGWIYLGKLIQAQCYSEQVQGTRVGDVSIERDDFDIHNFMEGIVTILIILKQEIWQEKRTFVQT